jgi:hypothetical protein
MILVDRTYMPTEFHLRFPTIGDQTHLVAGAVSPTVRLKTPDRVTAVGRITSGLSIEILWAPHPRCHLSQRTNDRPMKNSLNLATLPGLGAGGPCSNQHTET